MEMWVRNFTPPSTRRGSYATTLGVAGTVIAEVRREVVPRVTRK